MSSKTAARRLYVGVMSGTSIDGVDALLADFEPPRGGRLAVLGHVHHPFPLPLREELLALNTPGRDELHRAALAANALARAYADAMTQLFAQAGIERDEIIAAGVHGQTVRHRPGEFDGTGYTLQIGNAALLAELSGIDIVTDFRSRDVAAGGQGAPLVPAFHRALFGQGRRASAVLNLGGIANLTLLRPDGTTHGFDCGPANALMDGWISRHHSRPFDDKGAWAATGQPIASLLQSLLSEPYFALPYPKSTGRDLFNEAWLQHHLQAALPASPASRPEDVQATLLELTARGVADALMREAADTTELLVCGGGARNDALIARIASLLPPGVTVQATDARGLPAEQVEAAAFAWLAKAWVEHQPGNLPSVSGAKGERILGACYPH